MLRASVVMEGDFEREGIEGVRRGDDHRGTEAQRHRVAEGEVERWLWHSVVGEG